MRIYITVAHPTTRTGTWKRIIVSGRRERPKPARRHERSPSAQEPKPRTEVFLNLPYDKKSEKLFLAYVCGVLALGMKPRVTLEIPGGTRRLDRIFQLMQSCRFSIHDLSRVELDRRRPSTPRFNMPFELGLAVAWERMRKAKHGWFVMESMNYRLTKSLSDLNGTDAHIHGGTIRGVFRELGNAFVRRGKRTSVQQMWRIYREIRGQIPAILRQRGAASVFQAGMFRDISVAAGTAAARIVG
jgi:hypothetical protein